MLVETGFHVMAGPRFRLHGQAKTGDDAGIKLIGFLPNQLTLGKAFDPGRIDNADRVAGFMEIDGHFFSVIASCLQTRLCALHTQLPEPGSEILKHLLSVLEGLVSDLSPNSRAASILRLATSMPRIGADIDNPLSQNAASFDKRPVRINLASKNSFPFGTVSDTVRVTEQSRGKRI